jgi:hypothetical protein
MYSPAWFEYGIHSLDASRLATHVIQQSKNVCQIIKGDRNFHRLGKSLSVLWYMKVTN